MKHINETDVLVIGAGNAGLVAALAAHEVGAKVAVVEWAPRERRGGNSALAAGFFRCAFRDFDELRPALTESSMMPFSQVTVEPYTDDAFYNDLMRTTEGLADPALGALLVEQSFGTIAWMASKGVSWELDAGHATKLGNRYVIHSGTTVMMAREGGRGLVEMLFESVQRNSISVLYDCRAIDLLMDRKGSVIGVLLNATEGKKEFYAGAVILACGGFEANAAMRARYLGPGWDLVKVRGTRYNQGDGLRMSMGIGAMPYGHWSGCHASVIDAEAPDLEAGAAGASRYSFPFSIMVNRDGERFLDEGEDLSVFTYAKSGRKILAQPGSVAYQIFDQKTVGLLNSRYQNSRAIVAQTAEELADSLAVDVERLTKTIEDFNRGVQGGEFDPSTLDGKRTRGVTPVKSNWATPLDSPPFHAYAVTCGITFTYGGLGIDTECRVRAADGRVIPGLWAAGEMTGGFFYHNYPGAAGLTRGAVTGKISGFSAAKYAKGHSTEASQRVTTV
jgi:tricarballylate dehydrogenase